MCPASLPHLPLPPPTPHCHLKKKSGKSQLIILELRVASGNNLTHQWEGGNECGAFIELSTGVFD